MKSVKSTKNDRSVTITTPSFYGSHASMVVDPSDFDVELKEGEVICKDDKHYYITLKNRLDNGSADPNRYASNIKIEKRISNEEEKT